MIDAMEAIRGLLFEDWDPIGVNAHAPRDEYDSYAMPIFVMLQERRSAEDVAAYLDGVVTDRMGIVPDQAVHREIARRLIALRQGDS